MRSALSNLVAILKAESGAAAAAAAAAEAAVAAAEAEATAVAKAPATDGAVADTVAAASGSQLPEAEVAREPKVAAAPAQRSKVLGGVPAAPRAADVRCATPVCRLTHTRYVGLCTYLSDAWYKMYVCFLAFRRGRVPSSPGSKDAIYCCCYCRFNHSFFHATVYFEDAR